MKTMARPWNEAAAGAIGSGRRQRTIRRRWLPAWLGLAGLAVLNGVGRQALYARALGDLRAHQLSTATLIVVVGGYVWLLERRWPLPSQREALAVGGSWTVLTLLFEIGAGHYLFGNSWERLLADYNLLDGRVWVLIPLWVLAAPAVVRRMQGLAAGTQQAAGHPEQVTSSGLRRTARQGWAGQRKDGGESPGRG